MLVSRLAFTQVSDERDWLRAEVARLSAEVTRLTTAAPAVVADLPVALDPPTPLPEVVGDAIADVTRSGTEDRAKVSRWAREQVRNKRPADEIARAIREGEE